MTADFDQVRRFWQNPSVERALIKYDIASSRAHVRMLGETGIINRNVSQKVIEALAQILKELEDGVEFLSANDSDIHLGLERRLEEVVGDDAKIVKIAKSRNDQIATDIRLWLRDVSLEIYSKILDVRQVLVTLAERDLEVIMPGYTHGQPAMPILLAHWWLANDARFRRDLSRLKDLYVRMNALPLGACAIAGTNQPIDRSLVASYLAFDDVIENSLDAISDRDYLIEFSSFASIVGTHISQMSAEILLWATQEFGFVRLPRALVFRSQNMPQKRNPELLEILRSRPAILNGRLFEFLTQLKGLSISYSQDLQECLPGLIDVVENLKFILELTKELLPTLKFDLKRMRELANTDLTNAANAVDYLVERDIPLDKAASIVESLVSYCKERNKQLTDLSPNEWEQFSPVFGHEIYDYVAIDESVESRSSFGGTAQAQVTQALARAKAILDADHDFVRDLTGSKVKL
jgi:argininosuccinate lyase